MELSVFNPILADMTFEEALKYLSSLGVYSIELGCGGFPGTAHADAFKLNRNPDELEKLKELINKYSFKICALSTHCNPVHPNKETADKARSDFEETCILAEKLSVDTVIMFSGCPGDCENSRYPNWVVCPWPEDFLEILDYQWNKVLIPYWKEAADFAAKHSVKKIALEMHPGFCVYNPETVMKLRNAVGDIIGANVDPSHLIWQGIDPVRAIKYLGDAVHHFHAKDTKVDTYNTSINGVLDTKHYTKELQRSWIFRTVGYGSDAAKWKEIFSALNAIGYNGAVSIEHEDSLMSVKEGLEKAIDFLKNTMIKEPKPDGINWA